MHQDLKWQDRELSAHNPARGTDFLQTGNEGGGNSPPSKAGLCGWLDRDQRIESVHAHKMPCHPA